MATTYTDLLFRDMTRSSSSAHPFRVTVSSLDTFEGLITKVAQVLHMDPDTVELAASHADYHTHHRLFESAQRDVRGQRLFSSTFSELLPSTTPPMRRRWCLRCS